DPQHLVDEYDAVVLCVGATKPFDPTGRCPGRNLTGIHFAMDFLTRNTKSLLDSDLSDEAYLSARGKHVIVIGGGDTGADCVGTSLRHGAASIINLELLAPAPPARAANNPWPDWPRVYRVDYSHAEVEALTGEDPRAYNILTKEFIDDGAGRVKAVRTVGVDWSNPVPGGAPFTELPGTERDFPADLVLLATGFVGPELSAGELLGLATVEPRRGWTTFAAEHGKFATNVEGVFAAGDCRRGQSLVVWAINEGRGAARAVDQYLMGFTSLPAPGVNAPEQVV
ncbi:MAG TPA: FAD-dependent oxidoreductase, partial [Lacipirellulaceae bacterium]|nr:FAD-dependent oxidoreductase [Lacipirellulaceae bacterium]